MIGTDVSRNIAIIVLFPCKVGHFSEASNVSGYQNQDS